MDEKVRPGQAFDIAARTWNDMVDAKDFILKHRGALRNLLSRKTPDAPVPTDVITVKNITGVDRLTGEVLELGDVLFDRMEGNEIGFKADTVSHASGHSYCILRRPIPAGEVDDEVNGKLGPASVSGVCVAKVDIQEVGDRFAFVETSSYVLKSGKAGSFQLLGPVDATGEQLVAVVFAGGGGRIVDAALTEDLEVGDTAAADVLTRDGSDYTGETIEVLDTLLNSDETIPQGTKIVAREEGGVWTWLTARCVVSDTLPEA